MTLRFTVAIAACLIAGACSSVWDRHGEQTPTPVVDLAEGVPQESTVATNPEETALQTSTTSETPNTATAPPQLGEVGHVAALGEPDTSQFSPDYWASQETYTVDVYLCAPPGRYEFVQSAPFSPMEGSGQEVEEQLWSLRHDTATGKVARFFTRESTGLLNLYFTPRLTEIDLMTPTEMEESLERLAEGENPPDLDWKPRRQAGLSPPGMDWSSTTMEVLYEEASSGGLSACERPVIEHQAALAADDGERLAECESNPDEAALGRCFAPYPHAALLLVDAPLEQVAGFAKFGGLAFVSLQSAGGRLDSDEFAFIVAHELGHSILQLRHTDEPDGANCDDDKWALMRSNARCLSPSMGPNGLLDYEITCVERRLLGWRCEHEPPDEEWFNGWERRYQSNVQSMERLQERAEELEAAQGRGETMESLGDKWCLSVLLESSGALSGFTQSLSRLLDVAESWPDHPRVLRALEMLGVDGVGELPKLLVDTQTALDEVEARMSEGLQGGGYCNW